MLINCQVTLYHATLCRAKVLEWVLTQTKKFQSPSLGKSFHLFSLNFFPPSPFEISVLLSNCSKQSTNNARTEYKYPAILYGYLHSWLFCIVKYLSKRLAALACVFLSREKKSGRHFLNIYIRGLLLFWPAYYFQTQF